MSESGSNQGADAATGALAMDAGDGLRAFGGDDGRGPNARDVGVRAG